MMRKVRLRGNIIVGTPEKKVMKLLSKKVEKSQKEPEHYLFPYFMDLDTKTRN